MTDLLTVKEPPDHKLKVGSSSENYVALEITAIKDAKKLQAQIDIPCGTDSDKTYLCADAKRANLIPRSEPLKKLSFSKQQAGANVSWKSSGFSLNAGEKVTIKITGFSPERPGKATLDLKIGTSNPLPQKSYTVSIESVPEPTIVYFDVSPRSVPQHGKVTISSTTTGAKTVKLYANGVEVNPKSSDTTEVPIAKSSDTKETRTVNKYVHAPQAQTTYHLKAWQSANPGQSATPAEREITVSVEPRPGWYSRNLLANSLEPASAGQHFYPTLLLSAKDLSGATKDDLLYGIFVCKETKQAGLWSSSSGVDDWSFLGDVPDGMAESPGVIHKQALWLIGGSSADPLGHISNRVCWYYKNTDGEMVWKEWDEEGSERKVARVPAPRRCHACTVFDGKVWVLGGLSRQNKALADVWTCSADPASGNFTATWEPFTSLPSGRCLPVATATPEIPEIGVNQPRLWLCGGATHPYNLDETFYDLWWTEDGKAWNSFGLPEGKEQRQVLAATLLYDGGDQRLHLAGVFREPKIQSSVTSDYELNDVSHDISWNKGSLVAFAWDVPTDLFLIRSVSFRERWIFSPVYQDWAKAKSSAASIYFTKHRA
jgi:hypothetical protein